MIVCMTFPDYSIILCKFFHSAVVLEGIDGVRESKEVVSLSSAHNSRYRYLIIV